MKEAKNDRMEFAPPPLPGEETFAPPAIPNSYEFGNEAQDDSKEIQKYNDAQISTQRTNSEIISEYKTNNTKNGKKYVAIIIAIIFATAALVVLFITVVLPFLSGSNKANVYTETDYKRVIENHLSTYHKAKLKEYSSFLINKDKSASAQVFADFQMDDGGLGISGTVSMSLKLKVDNDCKLSYCDLCGDLNENNAYDRVESNNKTQRKKEIESTDAENDIKPEENQKNEVQNARVNSESGLFLRTGPSTNYESIILMPYASDFVVAEIEDGWAYGFYKDYSANREIYGWCSADYLILLEGTKTQEDIINQNETEGTEEYYIPKKTNSNSTDVDNDTHNNQKVSNDYDVGNSGYDDDYSPTAQLANEVWTGGTIIFDGVEWDVLDIQDGKALIISQKSINEKIDYGKYNDVYEDVTWETSSLRQKLNTEYYNSLSEDDKNRIVEVKNNNPDNAEYGTPGGNDTVDKVFLLSLDEAIKYKDILIGSYKSREIWLRSPGVDSKCAIIAHYSYYPFYESTFDHVDDVASICPACWIRLN